MKYRRFVPASKTPKFTVCLALVLSLLCVSAGAQDAPPFDVSNPKHKKWPIEEAARIYRSACALVARTVRPEKPPNLRPKFLLILGAKEDEIVRHGAEVELRLQAWDAENFAQAVVLMAADEVVRREEVPDLARSALLSSQASVSVEDLRQGR
jgi:hypothetical protein